MLQEKGKLTDEVGSRNEGLLTPPVEYRSDPVGLTQSTLARRLEPQITGTERVAWLAADDVAAGSVVALASVER